MFFKDNILQSRVLGKREEEHVWLVGGVVLEIHSVHVNLVSKCPNSHSRSNVSSNVDVLTIENFCFCIRSSHNENMTRISVMVDVLANVVSEHDSHRAGMLIIEKNPKNTLSHNWVWLLNCNVLNVKGLKLISNWKTLGDLSNTNGRFLVLLIVREFRVVVCER